ncbi:hypothetical protein VHEMI09190 [[Torrubiella] hemipterigena]|uniref:Uncharacterized protein n=1 Tax=[Torrubiella] hemipterigena TaxID=1531966 RepID=A0A0A1TR31_9HYPO|nr:hypothetical protein VHEMI09190 [[Torrubiella] hemipterigena]
MLPIVAATLLSTTRVYLYSYKFDQPTNNLNHAFTGANVTVALVNPATKRGFHCKGRGVPTQPLQDPFSRDDAQFACYDDGYDIANQNIKFKFEAPSYQGWKDGPHEFNITMDQTFRCSSAPGTPAYQATSFMSLPT